MRGSEENGGLHLTKKHKKTLLTAIFSRAGLIVLLMIGILFAIRRYNFMFLGTEQS